MIPVVRDLLERGVVTKVFPAAQACLVEGGEIVHASAHGGHRGRPADLSTLFDVSSLTKVVSTSTLAYVFLSRGELALEDPVGKWFPDATSREATIRHLLAHTSGLPPWAPLFASIPEEERRGPSAKDRILAAVCSTPLESKEGAKRSYSDLGFILLGAILERAGGAPLDRLFREEIAAPLRLSRTSFHPIPAPGAGEALPIAPTGDRRPRPPAKGQEGSYLPGESREAIGEVDDDNAWVMGGVAGHAGLFSTAEDVAGWGWNMLEELQGGRRLGEPTVIRELLVAGLGFDRPLDSGSSAGTLLGRQGPLGAAGHLGFTGCSVWIDLDRGGVVALLSNRVFPDRANDSIRRFRPSFHDVVVREWEKRENGINAN